jgi:hypothetical protein
MKAKSYAFLLICFFIGLVRGQAQDTHDCNAQFEVFKNGLSIYVMSIDTTPGTQHFWNFGDSTTLGYGNNAMVTHTYSHYGTFRVVQLVMNPVMHCADSALEVVTISPPVIDSSCNARFLVFHVGSPVDKQINTWALDSVAGLLHSWDFGDSTFLDFGTKAQVFHTYSHYGTFNVVQRIRNPATGCTDSISQLVFVNPPVADSADSGRTAGVTYMSSYPNPTSNQAGIDLKLSQPTMIYVSVYNSMGSPVLTTVVSGTQGMNHLQLPVGGMGTGIYYVRLQYGNETRLSKIQKL